ncbi:hypothetical protein J6590_077911 [Homalodisca vitripennis]|nr:hypothetical protein J6590_077911 [Homalodisca vitripennis]
MMIQLTRLITETVLLQRAVGGWRGRFSNSWSGVERSGSPATRVVIRFQGPRWLGRQVNHRDCSAAEGGWRMER